MSAQLATLIAATGSVLHAWAFALSPRWIRELAGDVLHGIRAHLLVVIVSFAGLGLVQVVGSELLGPGPRSIPISCWAWAGHDAARRHMCATHVADLRPQASFNAMPRYGQAYEAVCLGQASTARECRR